MQLQSVSWPVNMGTSVLLCSEIAEAEAVVPVNGNELVSDAYACANAARRASGPPKPFTVT